MDNVKENWKDTGKEFNSSFKKLGKTCVRSAKVVAKKAKNKISDIKNKNVVEATMEENEEGVIEVSPLNKKEQEKETNVFNDGSWKETGKDLGKAFTSLGKSIGNTFTGNRNK